MNHVSQTPAGPGNCNHFLEMILAFGAENSFRGFQFPQESQRDQFLVDAGGPGLDIPGRHGRCRNVQQWPDACQGISHSRSPTSGDTVRQ